MPLLLALLLQVAAYGATLNVATLDSGVDPEDDAIAAFISEERLAGIEFDGVDLRTVNRSEIGTHGTRVAARLLQDLPPDRVNFIPLVGHYTETLESKLRTVGHAFRLGLMGKKRRAAFLEEDGEMDYADIDRVITEEHIRIVVISIGLDLYQLGDIWTGRLPFADQVLRAGNAAQMRLVRRHPETLFVFAAGNEGVLLQSDLTHAIPNAGERNVLIVGALETRLRPADYSNFSPDLVDVLANGHWGDDDGTSFAGPFTANAIAVDLLENPGVSVAEARQRFLARACLLSPSFRGRCVGGRFFPGELALTSLKTFALFYEGDPSPAAFAESLERTAPADTTLLVNDLVVLEEKARPSRRNGTLRVARTRDRLARWLATSGPVKRILPYRADGHISRGLLIKDLDVTPLDYPATALAPLVQSILCETQVLRPNERLRL